MTQIGHLYYQMPADFHLYGPSKCLITLRKDDAKTETATGLLDHFIGLRHLSVWWVFLAKAEKCRANINAATGCCQHPLRAERHTSTCTTHPHSNEGTNGSTDEDACRYPEENSSFWVALNTECCCCCFHTCPTSSHSDSVNVPTGDAARKEHQTTPVPTPATQMATTTPTPTTTTTDPSTTVPQPTTTPAATRTTAAAAKTRPGLHRVRDMGQ